MTDLEKALEELRIDTERLGTYEYEGMAYFWSGEYKHTMRNLSREMLVNIHMEFVEEGLPLNGVSDRHREIITFWSNFSKL